MLELTFETIPEHLAYHSLINCERNRFIENTPHKAIVDFQNKGWKLDRETCDFLRHGYSEVDFLQNNVALGRRVSTLIATLIDDETFEILLRETAASQQTLKAEWDRNFVMTKNLLFEITGIVFDGNFKVVLTHPALRQGHYLKPLRTICWAARSTWENYNTVYLWHELLHEFLPDGHLGHAVIQLITDNELRIRLNGGDYPPFEGHPELNDVMDVLLPHWRRFQKDGYGNIHEFVENMSECADVTHLLKHRKSTDRWR